MRLFNKIAVISTVAFSALTYGNTYAASAYVEANGGYSYINDNSINGISSDGQSNFGFNFNVGLGGVLEYTSFELGYTYLGEPTYNGSETALNNLDFAAVLHIPVMNQLSLLAKTGLGVTFMGSSSYTGSETKFAYLLGAGARYALGSSLYVQGLYQFYGNNGNIPDANVFTAGIGFVF